jgi:small multidrug resistance pump
VDSQLFVTLLVLVTVTFNTTAQTLLKLGAGQDAINLYIVGGIFLYGLSTIFYILILSKLNLSLIYPIVIGLTIIATMIVGSAILKERVSTTQWLGMGLLVSGIWAIAFGKKV